MSEKHKVCSKGDVPFSWEQKPGISKVTPQIHFHHPKLPPPPCGAALESCRRYPLSYHRDLQIPPPPCTFQPALRNSSQKGARKQDDPFLIAYKECTKSVRSKGNKFMWFSKDDGVEFGAKKKKKNTNLFSCKNSCSVVEDKIVRVSQLTLSRSHREEGVFKKWSP